MSGGESDNLHPTGLYKKDHLERNILTVATYMNQGKRYLVPVVPVTAPRAETIRVNTLLEGAEYFPQHAYLVESRYLKDDNGNNIKDANGKQIIDTDVISAYYINPQAVLVPDAVQNYREDGLLDKTSADLYRQRMQVHKEYYGRPPSLFALNINRDGRNPNTGLTFKIEGAFPIHDSVEIPVVTFEDGQFYTREHRYRCCGIVFHIGATAKSGHYVSCTKIGNKWIYFNDSQQPIEKTWDDLKSDTFTNPYDTDDRTRFKVADKHRPTIVIALYQLTDEPASDKNPF